jgi:hypothetical protein
VLHGPGAQPVCTLASATMPASRAVPLRSCCRSNSAAWYRGTRASRATTAFLESDRPDRPGADERNGDNRDVRILPDPRPGDDRNRGGVERRARHAKRGELVLTPSSVRVPWLVDPCCRRLHYGDWSQQQAARRLWHPRPGAGVLEARSERRAANATCASSRSRDVLCGNGRRRAVSRDKGQRYCLMPIRVTSAS